MTKKILVTYATSYGSTAEIAQFISDALQNEHIEVELLPLRQVRSVDAYHAVILGAPIYMFHWHKQALRFLEKYRHVFENGLPVAVFAGGPFAESTEKEWQEVRDQFEKELAGIAWFKPAAKIVVGGKFDPQRLRLPYSLIPALKQLPASDSRDWQAIRAWAQSLPQVFKIPV